MALSVHSRKQYLHDFLSPQFQSEYLIYNVFDGDIEAFNVAHKAALNSAKPKRAAPQLMAQEYERVMSVYVERYKKKKRAKENYERRQQAKAESEQAQRAPMASKPVTPAPTPPPSSPYQPTGKSEMGEWVNGKWVSSPAQQFELTRYMRAPNIAEAAAKVPFAFGPNNRLQPGYGVGLDKYGNIMNIHRHGDRTNLFKSTEMPPAQPNMPPAWS